MGFVSSRRLILVSGLFFILVSACSLDPNVRKQNYFQSGQSYFEKGKYREAVVEFTNVIKIDPAFAEAHFQLAESFLKLQQQHRAYEELQRTLELRPEDYRARIELTNVLILGRNFQPAQEQMDLLLKMRPSDPGVHALASSLLAAQGKIPGAIAETQKTIALAPNRWETYLSLGLLQVKDNQPDAAEQSFKKVIELDPKAMQPHLVLGSFYQAHSRSGEAGQQFQAALALDPGSVDPRRALAGLYLADGKRADAENVLKQAKHDLPQNPESILALSNFYFSTGDMDKAIAEYQELYQARPNDLQVKKKYIQLLIEARRYDQARSLDDEILKSNAKDDDALVYRSEMQISSGNVSDAAQTLQTLVANSPDNIQVHYALGVAFEKQGNLQRAEGEWREALRLDPDYLDAQRSIANAAILQGDMNTLEDAASQMIRLQPGSPDGYALRALANINRTRYAIAEQDIRRSIAVGPQSAFGYVQLGNLRLAQKQFSDAAKAYQEALDRNANSTDALRGLMNAYVAQKQVDKAIEAANAQILKSPANSSFYDLLGGALFHLRQDLGGAESALQKSVDLDKRNSDALIQLCQVLAVRGKIDQAIALGSESLKENSRQPNLYILLGDLYVAKSDWKSAQNAYQSALANDSQNPVASIDLARVMLNSGGDFDVALGLAQAARRGLPNSPMVVGMLGWIYYQKGVYPLAVNYLQEALKVQEENKLPDGPEIHYHLGMAYEKTNQAALAQRELDQVLKNYPNYRENAEIKKALAQLKS